MFNSVRYTNVRGVEVGFKYRPLARRTNFYGNSKKVMPFAYYNPPLGRVILALKPSDMLLGVTVNNQMSTLIVNLAKAK